MGRMYKQKVSDHRKRSERQARKVLFTIIAVFVVLMFLLWAYSSVVA